MHDIYRWLLFHSDDGITQSICISDGRIPNHCRNSVLIHEETGTAYRVWHVDNHIGLPVDADRRLAVGEEYDL